MNQTDNEAWLKSGAYLPEALRDFHNQKEVFMAMHTLVAETPESGIARPSWIEGQCYVIDVFLWFMARRGYTLQRTRRKGTYRDLAADVKNVTQARERQFTALLLHNMETNTPPKAPELETPDGEAP